MQNRLEKAKHEIKENVSRSRSRSKSPNEMQMQMNIQMQQAAYPQAYPSMTSQNYMVRQRPQSSQKSNNSQIHGSNRSLR